MEYVRACKLGSNLTFSDLFVWFQVLKDYFKTVDEDHIKDNFVLVYELLDEMMDNGYPQVVSAKENFFLQKNCVSH